MPGDVLLVNSRAKKVTAPRLQNKGVFKNPTPLQINGPIRPDGVTAAEVACSRAIAAKSGLEVTIDSTGGYVASAYGIVSAIQTAYIEFGARIIVRGMCASAAIDVLTGLPAHSRYATRNSRFIIHEARDFSGKRVPDADVKAAKALAANSRIDYDSLLRVMRRGGRYEISAQEALTFGLIGRII